MLNVEDLVEGVTKVRILVLPKHVKQDIGDVGIFQHNDGGDTLPLAVDFGGEYWYFDPYHLEIVENSDEPVKLSTLSEDLIIYKSRWNEIIENLSKPLNIMTDEEVEIVKSVLKNNVPYSVVNDPVIVDPVIAKEDQTHLDANYVGVGRNGCFYYRSDTLKQWFWWNEDYEWGECDFDYNDIGDVLPVSFGIVIGEGK